MIVIKGFNEKRKRCFEGFPFEIYRSSGVGEGIVITPAHYHNEIELMMPKKGITDLAVEGENITAVKGNIYVINPNEVHAMYANTDSYYYAMVFPKELLELNKNNAVYLRLIAPLFEGRLQLQRNINDSRSLELFTEIEALNADVTINSPLILSRLLELMWHFEKSGYIKSAGKDKVSPIHRAIDYMENHISEKLTLAQIAECAGMSPKYFCAYFKKHTLTTAVSYLNTLRIKKAQQLLKTTDYSVLEISLLCGFDNVSFFIKKFKEAVGQTPANYKKLYLKIK